MKLTKPQAALLRAMQAGDVEIKAWPQAGYYSQIGSKKLVTPTARALVNQRLAAVAGERLTLTPKGKEWSDADQSG